MRLLEKSPDKLMSKMVRVEDSSLRQDSVTQLLSPHPVFDAIVELVAALTACSYPLEICCSVCGRRNVEVVGELGEMTIFTFVEDRISPHRRVYEPRHVTCETAIKPAMVFKRLTVKLQPVGIDVGCQVRTYEVDYSMNTRLSRNQHSQLTTDDMAF
nr:hypothetical protein HmN_000723300 [Hymenolepis microstoma]